MDMPLSNRWLKNWHLGAVFTATLVVFTVIRLPASLFLPDSIRGHVSGTVWEAQAKTLSVNGYKVENVRVSVSLLPVFVGNISGTMNLAGPYLHGKTGFDLAGDIYQFRNLALKNIETITLFGEAIGVSSTITASQLKVDHQGACLDGGFKLKTDLLQNLFSRINKTAPMLNGTATCRQGKVRLELAGQSNKMIVHIGVLVDKNGKLVADTIFRAPDGDVLDDDIQHLLQAAGLKANGVLFEGQIALDLLP